MQVRIRLAAALLAALPSLVTASVFYKFDIVGQTGTSIVSLGVGPSINDKGKVAYVANFSNGSTVFVAAPVFGQFDIASNFLSPQRTFGESVRINRHDEVLTWTRDLSVGLYELVVFRSATANDTTVMVRGSSSPLQHYDVLYQHPAFNANQVVEDRVGPGDDDGVCEAGETCASQVAFTAIDAASSPPRSLATVAVTPNAADPGLQNEVPGYQGQISRPAMADDGRIAIRDAGTSSPIRLYDYNLVAAPVQIAGSTQGFTALGVAPGITADGKIVAFAGRRGQGDGIFLSIQLPSGTRRLVRIAGENATVQKPELGYTDTAGKLFFQTIDLDSRVGIVFTPGRSGAANGAVVVSFVGTPNAASRTNPGTAKPYVHSAQKGLWTMRIELDAPLMQDTCNVLGPGVTGNPLIAEGDDHVVIVDGVPYIDSGNNQICESGNGHDVETLFARAGPIPVVQVGDRILAHTVVNIAVHDPIAPANFNDVGGVRNARLGDHRVAFWADVGSGTQLIVRGEHLDSDQDGLMDHWETTGIDLEGTGTIDLDLAAMGANPLVRDLFVQMDWTADRAVPLNKGSRHRPRPGVLRQLAQMYAAAPATPAGVQAGIRLHVDGGPDLDRAGQSFSRNMGVGPLRGGKTVAPQPIDILFEQGLPGSVNIPGVNAVALDTVAAANFRNSHRGAREFAFRYVVWGDHTSGLDEFGEGTFDNAVTGTVTLAGPWGFFDDANAKLAGASRGHGVLITGGTGAGQLRSIADAGQEAGTNKWFLVVVRPWHILPDTTSTYVLLDGSTGVALPSHRYDGGRGPGKNVIVAHGASDKPPGPEQGNFLYQWSVLAHELGHLLTLMHGGTDHDNYKPSYVSLMNYGYEVCKSGVGTDENGNPLPGGAACPVTSYAGAADAVHNDWATLDWASALNPASTGQAFGPRPNFANEPFPEPTQPALTEGQIVRQHGEIDATAPVVAVTSPPGGTAVTPGSGIAVSFTATDNVRVVRAEVLFDVNGNGEIDEPAEVFAATSTGGSNFTATVPAIAGASSTRTLTVYAFDQNGTPGTAYVRINVGSVAALIVPNVVGALEQAASDALVAAQFQLGAVTFQQSAVAVGAVISQNPAAGQSRPPGTPVALATSLGPSGAKVPDVTGLSQSQASAALATAGFAVGAITSIGASSLFPANSVAGQSPVGGGIAAAGSAVQLLVVTGAGITVPNLVGLTQAAAVSAIQSATLVVGTITQQASASVPAGSVISHVPVSGTVAVQGSAVHLVISTGGGGITVPNVVGLTQAAATSAITGAGLVVGTVTQQISVTVPAGDVISQNPTGGTSVASGSAVDLVVSTGTTAPPPAVSGRVSRKAHGAAGALNLPLTP